MSFDARLQKNKSNYKILNIERDHGAMLLLQSRPLLGKICIRLTVINLSEAAQGFPYYNIFVCTITLLSTAW
jgi:hypothetical protein